MAFVTYETIAYRIESNIGTQRKICSETLGQIDAIEGTFCLEILQMEKD